MISIQPAKSCKKCGKIKPLSGFYEHYSTADRRRGTCMDCMRDAALSYRNEMAATAAGRKYLAEASRRWRQRRKSEIACMGRLNSAGQSAG